MRSADDVENHELFVVAQIPGRAIRFQEEDD